MYIYLYIRKLQMRNKIAQTNISLFDLIFLNISVLKISVYLLFALKR